MADYGANRSIVSLNLGARIGLVVAALLLVVAGFHIWAPVNITGRGGLQFDCGSVLHPPSGQLQSGTCGSVVDRERTVVIFTAIAAAVVAAGSIYAFGASRRRETLLPPAPETEDEPNPEAEAPQP
jgi:hypothetical protein